MEKLLTTDVKEIVALAASVYNCPPPPVKIGVNVRTCGGSIGVQFGLAKLHRTDWLGGEDLILHETTHYIQWRLYSTCYHDAAFYRLLKGLATEYYGDPSKYRWDMEYKSIYNRAKKEGLVTKGWGEDYYKAFP